MSPHTPLPSVMGLEILLASSHESDHDSLRVILGRCNCGLHCFRSCREAVSFLREHPVGVMITSATLPDGTWESLLSEISLFPDAPNLIVASRLADERLWAEVLNMGGYDLIFVPYDADEVLRITTQAWLDWERKQILRLGRVTAASRGPFDLAGRVAITEQHALKDSAVIAAGNRSKREKDVPGHKAREPSRWAS